MRFAVVLLVSTLIPFARGGENTGEVKRIDYEVSTNISGVSFEITVRSDGTVEYNGQDLVKQLGHRTSKISKNDFEKLVHKIHEIKFFDLEDRYDSYRIEPPAKPQPKRTQSAFSEATDSRITVTDLPSRTVTVVTTNRKKSVDDRLGAPKGLFELEWLVLDLTHASQWIGSGDDARDVPYYDSFRESKRVTYRGLLGSYTHSTDRNAPVAGYDLQLINNPGIDFELRTATPMNLQEFNGWIVDVTGTVTRKEKAEPEFVASNIRRVRKYSPFPVQKK